MRLVNQIETPQLSEDSSKRSNSNESQAILDQKIRQAKKKKYLWWGLGILVFAAILTVVLVLVLKKGKDP